MRAAKRGATLEWGKNVQEDDDFHVHVQDMGAKSERSPKLSGNVLLGIERDASKYVRQGAIKLIRPSPPSSAAPPVAPANVASLLVADPQGGHGGFLQEQGRRGAVLIYGKLVSNHAPLSYLNGAHNEGDMEPDRTSDRNLTPRARSVGCEATAARRLFSPLV